MKKIVSIVLCLLLAISSGTGIAGDALRIVPIDQADTAFSHQSDIANLRVTNQVYGAYTVATITFEAGGEAFEWVCGGLDQPLSEADAAYAVSCFLSGTAFTMESDGLVDAEKATNKLPCAEGVPLSGDDPVRTAYEWGDSKQCWAGSLSDMLLVTGWGTRAINPLTGAAFASEDELFSYFTANFSNGGCYQSDGAAWFFSGTYERDVGMASLRQESSGGLLPDESIPVTRLLGEEIGTAYAQQLETLFLTLQEGACIGLDVDMYELLYPLKADENAYASYDEERQTYRWEEFHFCESTDVLSSLPFVLNEAGDLLLVTDAGGDQYMDAQGNLYPAAQVMVGQFVNYQGSLFPTTCEENRVEDRFFSIRHTATEDELQLDAAESSYAGSHALTAIGYIRCTSGQTPGLRALMIIDSDNSAHIYSPVGDDAIKESRPNMYTLYFVESYSFYDYTTLALSDYIGRKAPITGVTLMTSAAE